MGCDSSKLSKNNIPQRKRRDQTPVIDSSAYRRNDVCVKKTNILKNQLSSKKNEQKAMNQLRSVLDKNIIDFSPKQIDLQNVIKSQEEYKRKQNEIKLSRNNSKKTIKNQFDPYQIPSSENSEKIVKQKSVSPKKQSGNDIKLESFKDIKPIYSLEQFQKEIKTDTKQQEKLSEDVQKSQNKEKISYHRRAHSMNEIKPSPRFQLKNDTAQVEVLVKEGTKEYNKQMTQFKNNKAELQQNQQVLQEDMIQNLLDLQIKQYEQVEQIQNEKSIAIEEAELQKEQWQVVIGDQKVKIEELEQQQQLLKQEQISLENKHKENISQLFVKLNMSVAQLSQKNCEFESIRKQYESKVSRSTEHTSNRGFTEHSELDTTVNTISESIWIEKGKHESAFVNLQNQLKNTMKESEFSIKKIQSFHLQQIEKVKSELQEELTLQKVRSSKIIENQQNQIMQLKKTSDLCPQQIQKLQRASIEKNTLQQQLQRALEELERQQQEINQLRNSQKSMTLSPSSKASQSPSPNIQLSPIEYQRTKKFFENPLDKEIKQ